MSFARERKRIEIGNARVIYDIIYLFLYKCLPVRGQACEGGEGRSRQNQYYNNMTCPVLSQHFVTYSDYILLRAVTKCIRILLTPIYKLFK